MCPYGPKSRMKIVFLGLSKTAGMSKLAKKVENRPAPLLTFLILPSLKKTTPLAVLLCGSIIIFNTWDLSKFRSQIINKDFLFKDST